MRYRTLWLMFSIIVALNLADLFTTWVAVKDGLHEGNFLLLGVASGFKLSLFQADILSKIGFMLGNLVLVLIGLRNKTRIVPFALFLFILILLFVVANNLGAILSE